MMSRLTRMHAALAAGLCAVIFAFMFCAAAQAETLYFHRGRLGSVGLVSNAAGKIVARTRFQPYGEPTTVGSETDANAYARFTGKRKDSASGLYYFGARYYDAGLGRFLSPDPAQQIPSPYAYAGSAPLVNVDPDGRIFYAFFSHTFSRMFDARIRGKKVDMRKYKVPMVGNLPSKRVPTAADFVMRLHVEMKMPTLSKGDYIWAEHGSKLKGAQIPLVAFCVCQSVLAHLEDYMSVFGRNYETEVYRDIYRRVEMLEKFRKEQMVMDTELKMRLNVAKPESKGAMPKGYNIKFDFITSDDPGTLEALIAANEEIIQNTKMRIDKLTNKSEYKTVKNYKQLVKEIRGMQDTLINMPHIDRLPDSLK